MGWACLASKGAPGGILLLWDMSVVNLVEEFVGEFLVACSLVMWMMVTSGLLMVFMARMWTTIKNICGRKLLACVVGGMGRAALGGF